jgi:hypothetical protein
MSGQDLTPPGRGDPDPPQPPFPSRRGRGEPAEPESPRPLGGEGVGGGGPAHALHLPPPTVWPCAAAAGITLVAFGIVTTLAFSLAGGVLLAFGLAGWLRELFRE